MTKQELKPCPFCNGEGVIYEYSTVGTCPCSMRPAQPAEAEGVRNLHERVRPGVEAAPWVCKEIETLVAQLSAVTAELTAAAIAYRIRGDVIAELTAERDAERRRADVAVADANDAERERDQLRAEVEGLRPVAREFAGFFSSDEPRHWELHALADGAAMAAKDSES